MPLSAPHGRTREPLKGLRDIRVNSQRSVAALSKTKPPPQKFEGLPTKPSKATSGTKPSVHPQRNVEHEGITTQGRHSAQNLDMLATVVIQYGQLGVRRPEEFHRCDDDSEEYDSDDSIDSNKPRGSYLPICYAGSMPHRPQSLVALRPANTFTRSALWTALLTVAMQERYEYYARSVGLMELTEAPQGSDERD